MEERVLIYIERKNLHNGIRNEKSHENILIIVRICLTFDSDLASYFYSRLNDIIASNNLWAKGIIVIDRIPFGVSN